MIVPQCGSPDSRFRCFPLHIPGDIPFNPGYPVGATELGHGQTPKDGGKIAVPGVVLTSGLYESINSKAD